MKLQRILLGTSAAAILTVGMTLGAAAQDQIRGNAGATGNTGVSERSSGGVDVNAGARGNAQMNAGRSNRGPSTNGSANLRANSNMRASSDMSSDRKLRANSDVRSHERLSSSKGSANTHVRSDHDRFAETRESRRYGHERFEGRSRYGVSARAGYNRDRYAVGYERDRYAVGYRRHRFVTGYGRDRDFDRGTYGARYSVGVTADKEYYDRGYYDYAPGFAVSSGWGPGFYHYAPGFSVGVGLYDTAPSYSTVGLGVGPACTCGG